MATGQADLFRESLAAGGECGRLIAATDWSATALGPIECWPVSLRTATSLLLRSPVPIVMLWGVDGIMLYNDSYSVFAGGRHPQLLGSKVREGWVEVADFNDHVMKVGLAGGTLQYRDQELTLHRHGRPEQVWMNLDYSPVLDENGVPAGVFAIVVETSERVRAERRTREANDRFRAFLTASNNSMYRMNPDWSELRQLDGQGFLLDTDVPTGDWIGTYIEPEDRPQLVAAVERAVATGEVFDLEHRVRQADGSIGWAHSRAVPIRGADGRIVEWFGAAHDVTARRAAEEEVRRSEARFRLMADAVPQIVWITDAAGRMEFLNRQFTLYTGADYDAFTPAEMAASFIPPEDGGHVVAAFETALRTGEPFDVEHRIRSAAGEHRWFVARAEPYRDPETGEIVRWFGVSVDIHDRKLAEAQLRELNETLEQRVASALAERKVFSDVLESSTASVTALDLDYRTLAINRTNLDAFEIAYGCRPNVGDRLLDTLADLPEDREQLRRNWSRALAGEEFVVTQAFGSAGRERRHYEVRFGTIRDADGNRIGAASTAYDVSDRVDAERQLAAAQEQLRQSQKMEAMGQLTGGVAHDFNNLLTPIVGSLDMLQHQRLGGPREQRLIAGAIQSAERARTLVQRLLAFARRQPLQPVPVDIEQLVTGMGELIASTTGPQIKVVVDAAASLPPARADPNQLEMALLNLAVNARDAMPEGGRLRITARVEQVANDHPARLSPGRYVVLSVADTGSGMDEATIRRAIEPFFSTKGIGKGTGLGLSMVHGLASQLGGALTIQSRIGIGTNVELWLPESATSVARVEDDRAAAAQPDVRGVALIVDDEDLVRMTTADMLADLGYSVVEAASAEEAMRLMVAGRHVDILVTDHLMPGITGADLIRWARNDRPEIQALLVSGYAEQEAIGSDIPRLAKPFRKADLAGALSRA
ncbi:histidine kinase [Sphingomonas metalli]|uniref:histidine kinase n=1 Tax=Sphingomonas metalli TaxID=1779358 RepID=A0A916WWM2_9SPHN|nr:PAS domain-containing protein [Sphingomonas metalli]GGB36219.1 histidine kinase [Sphingomonas metalli]